jgi:hypothetical protein
LESSEACEKAFNALNWNLPQDGIYETEGPKAILGCSFKQNYPSFYVVDFSKHAVAAGICRERTSGDLDAQTQSYDEIGCMCKRKAPACPTTVGSEIPITSLPCVCGNVVCNEDDIKLKPRNRCLVTEQTSQCLGESLATAFKAAEAQIEAAEAQIEAAEAEARNQSDVIDSKNLELQAAADLNTELQQQAEAAAAEADRANADLPTRIKTLNDSVLVSEWASRQNC